MKVLKSLIALTVLLLLLFSCSNPSMVEGASLDAEAAVQQGFQADELGAEYVELIVGLKESNRALSTVAGDVEAAINSVVSTSSRGGAISLKRVHDVKTLTGDISANSRASQETIVQAAYDSLSTDVERALYRDFQFTVHKDLAAKVMVELAGRADIEYVQENYLYEQLYQPNDPALKNGQLYGITNTYTDKAWAITQGSAEVIVAVIDSGIERNHPDLKDNIWVAADGSWGHDFSDNDTDPSPTTSDHGTHVAGTIGAVGNNGIGLIGVAPKVKLMSVKIFPRASSTVCANAIRYAVDNGARVLNNSWGSRTRRPSDPTIENAIKYAHSKGAVVIFAAGNSNDDSQYYYGGNSPYSICVASVDSQNKKSSFSNYGKVIDIAAPGSRVYSTLRYGKYGTKSGTSMAAPHVAGLAALILSKYPHYSNEKVREVIKSTAIPVTATNIGAGVMNSLKALGGSGPVDNVAPSKPAALKATFVTSSSVTLAWNASTDNVGVVGYKLYKGGVYSKTVTGLDAVVNGLTAATTYRFELTAIDAAGNESAKAALSVTTEKGSTGGDTVAPSVPAALKATFVTSSSVTLAWNASTDNVGVTGYKLYKDGVYSKTVTGLDVVVSGLKAAATYKFALTAVDAAGNESAKSSALSVTTKPDSTGGVAEWKTGVSYKVGDLVTYKGVTYRCRMAHNSLSGWTPVNVPALWSKQ